MDQMQMQQQQQMLIQQKLTIALLGKRKTECIHYISIISLHIVIRTNTALIVIVDTIITLLISIFSCTM